jgi:hypothetical protein
MAGESLVPGLGIGLDLLDPNGVPTKLPRPRPEAVRESATEAGGALGG